MKNNEFLTAGAVLFYLLVALVVIAVVMLIKTTRNIRDRPSAVSTPRSSPQPEDSRGNSQAIGVPPIAVESLRERLSLGTSGQGNKTPSVHYEYKTIDLRLGERTMIPWIPADKAQLSITEIRNLTEMPAARVAIHGTTGIIGHGPAVEQITPQDFWLTPERLPEQGMLYEIAAYDSWFAYSAIFVEHINMNANKVEFRAIYIRVDGISAPAAAS